MSREQGITNADRLMICRMILRAHPLSPKVALAWPTKRTLARWLLVLIPTDDPGTRDDIQAVYDGLMKGDDGDSAPFLALTRIANRLEEPH